MSDKPTRLFVAGFPRHYDSHDLEKKFQKYGKLKEVLMKKGFAFVEFEESQEAEEAMTQMNGYKSSDSEFVVTHATPKEPKKNTRLFVANFPKDFKTEEIEEIFAKYGEVKDTQIIRGFAFIEFEEHTDADYAREKLNGYEISGEKLVVTPAHPKGSTNDTRNGQDSRYGGGRSSHMDRRGGYDDRRFGSRGGYRDNGRRDHGRRRSYSRSRSRGRRDDRRQTRRRSYSRSRSRGRRDERKDNRRRSGSRENRRRSRSNSSGGRGRRDAGRNEERRDRRRDSGEQDNKRRERSDSRKRRDSRSPRREEGGRASSRY